VTEDDCRLLFDWANDAETRRQSTATDQIPLETHQAWFAARLRDTPHHYLVLDGDGVPAGVVRFDAPENGETISNITVAPEHRGRGLATDAIRLGCDRLRSDPAMATVLAYIRPTNAASLRSFTRAGFQDAGLQTFRNTPMQLMILPLRDEERTREGAQ
jgi:RimJ/RimL family protein N-acetyltransferase